MNGKLYPLEAARGVAAFAVLLNHFFLAFLPALHGALPGFGNPDSLIGTWAFLFMNGSAAVTFFFVLSGYVLTLRYFKNEKIELMLIGFAKRLPRLVGPVLVAVLLSCALFKAGLYFHAEAAALSGSPWLQGFGFSGLPADFHPSWWQAFKQGTYSAFFRGEVFYNSNLWTMPVELRGSWLVFVLAPLVVVVFPRRWRGVAAVAMLLAAFAIKPVYASFVAGMLMAYWHAHSTPQIRTLVALPILVFALYLLGYLTPSATYFWVEWLAGITNKKWVGPTLIHTFASCLLIQVLIGHGKTNSLLQGRFSQWLGKLSFPVYLLQLPILFSVSCWLYVELGSSLNAIVVNLALTLLATITVAIPLALFDRIWVATINRTFGAVARHLMTALGCMRCRKSA